MDVSKVGAHTAGTLARPSLCGDWAGRRNPLSPFAVVGYTFVPPAESFNMLDAEGHQVAVIDAQYRRLLTQRARSHGHGETAGTT